MRQIVYVSLGFATLLLSGCATVDAAPGNAPQPGYRCHFEQRGSFGVISSDFDVRSTGERDGAYIRWDAGNGDFANPWVTGAWFRQPDGHFSLDYGYISIMRHIWERRLGKPPRPMTLSLELSPTIAPIMKTSRLASDLQRSGGPFHLQLNWSDVAAMARGSSNLYLIARNSRLEVVDQVGLDRTTFARAEPHITSAFETVNRMLADPSGHCSKVEDLRDDDIIVT